MHNNLRGTRNLYGSLATMFFRLNCHMTTKGYINKHISTVVVSFIAEAEKRGLLFDPVGGLHCNTGFAYINRPTLVFIAHNFVHSSKLLMIFIRYQILDLTQ